MFVKERFVLNDYTKDTLRNMEPQFGYNGFGELIFYRTYSRNWDGYQENYADVIIRVIEGCFSIRKDWYIKNYISWNEKYWQQYAHGMAISLFKMEWMLAGRGYWIMGTPFLYERGSMAAQNCGYTDIRRDLGFHFEWMFDALMLGVGVGFSPIRDDKIKFRFNRSRYEHVISDDREGWSQSVMAQLRAYQKGTPVPNFVYDEIRPRGEPIRGFGGIASGPQPLKELHSYIEELCHRYMEDTYYDSVMFKADIGNLLGVCTVAGNVRRSAEKMDLDIDDPVFIDLKDYENPRFAYRRPWGWMSNNAASLSKSEHFEKMDMIANRVKTRGEPGYNNLMNFPYGRIGKTIPVRKDKARNTNPCGESLVEDKELCNQSETCPTVCINPEHWLKACEYATFYASTVSLLPTHKSVTNKVVARNRRITVGLVDFTGWLHDVGMNKITRYLREGYAVVTKTNQQANGEAGVPEAIRKTTVKPGGTTPKMPGKTPGAGYPTFKHTLRRVRVARNSPIHPLLVEANIPYEQDIVDPYTDVFEYPILQGPSPAAEKVSLWQQAMNLVLLQREWADNAVSNTLYFKPKWVLKKQVTTLNDLQNYLAEHVHTEVVRAQVEIAKLSEEFEIDDLKIKIDWDDETDDFVSAKIFKYDPNHEEHHIEPVLSAIAPLTKTVSLLPHSPKGVYAQMPEEGISDEEYNNRLAAIKKIDWSKLQNSDGQDVRYCEGQQCDFDPSR